MDKGNTKPAGTLVDRRRFLEFAGAGGAALILSRSSKASGAAPRVNTKLPNFVIIFTDDQGYNDLGCYGSPTIKTPHLDKMAAEGLKFTDFYVAASVCTPSRAALMTGCYPRRVSLPHVLFPNTRIGINPDEITIAEILKGQGYATMCIGKWHLGHLPPFLPTRHGFAHYFGLPYSNDMRPETNPRRYPPLPLIRDENIIEENPDQSRLTERYTDEAIRFISENKGRPFFLYLPHTMPHVPLYVSERFRGKSAGGLYGDVIECIDWSAGQILDTLARLGLAENTLVVFTTDNGPWLQRGKHGGSALPLRAGKGTMYEGGFRVPCIMRWPGRIPAGAVCSEMATTMDLLPTMARLAGTEPPSDRIIDGKDIWPLMAGAAGARSPHEAFYYYTGNNLRTVRSGEWKLVFEGTRRREVAALYNLEADIGETENVIAERPAVAVRLRALAEKIRDDIGDDRTKRPGKNCRPQGRIGQP